MKFPANNRDLYARYVATCAEEARLTAERKDMKAEIIKRLGTDKSRVEAGFAVKLTPGIRKTANASRIETTLNVKLTDACFTITPYDSLSVTKLTA